MLRVLVVQDDIRVDPVRMAEIVNELGGVAARNVVGLAVEQLATLLQDARAQALSDDKPALMLTVERLARLAWQVGLVSLSAVAVDVGSSAHRGDDVAMAATVARLMRVGNRSVVEIWDDGPLAG